MRFPPGPAIGFTDIFGGVWIEVPPELEVRHAERVEMVRTKRDPCSSWGTWSSVQNR